MRPLAIIFLLSACNFQKQTPVEASLTDGTVATFQRVQTEILVPQCVRCHSVGMKTDLSSFEAVIRTGKVVPHDPERSELYRGVFTGKMPLGGSKLSDEQIQLIYDWISDGAIEGIRESKRVLCYKGIESYSKTVYPHIRQDCVPCHGDGGMAGQSHSGSNMERSYSHVMSYVNFANIGGSYFVKKGGDRHCRKYEGKCTSTEVDIARVVQGWWDEGQRECEAGGNLITRPQKPPVGDGVMSFSLSHFKPEFASTTLEVSVRREEGAYTMDRPRLAPDVTVRIRGIFPLLNGKPQPSANSWRFVSASLPPQRQPGVLLSTAQLRVPIEQGETDEIAFAIERLETREPFACTNMKDFEASVIPVLEARSCYRCHGGGPTHETGDPRAKRFLNLDNDRDKLCLELLTRGNGHYTVDSPLIALPLRGFLGHPRAIPLSSDILPEWVEWIQSEGAHPSESKE